MSVTLDSNLGVCYKFEEKIKQFIKIHALEEFVKQYLEEFKGFSNKQFAEKFKQMADELKQHEDEQNAEKYEQLAEKYEQLAEPMIHASPEEKEGQINQIYLIFEAI